MTLRFEPIDNPYADSVFKLMKAGLYPYVEKVFGWDDDFQRQRLRDDYQADWFYWVYNDSERLGFVCFKPYDDALHLHLIVLDEKYRGHGYGKATMAAIHERARKEERHITLSSFKCNAQAVGLYQSLGYEITETEAHFVLFRLAHENNRLPSSVQID